MSEENDYPLKYFFLYGVSEDIKNILKLNYFKKDNKINPTLLSSYSAEGKTNLYQHIQKELKNSQYLKDNIFPKTAKFNKKLFPLSSSNLKKY